MKTYLIAFAMIALGCSSTTVSQDDPYAEETGGSAGAAGIGDAGTGNDVSGSGGKVVQPTGGTGADLAGGTAGEPSLGGTSGEPSTGGTGGTCVPKTCTTIAVEISQFRSEYNTNPGVQLEPEACDLHDDGCGNIVNCGGCSSPLAVCGGGDFYNNEIGGSLYGNVTEGLCQGGCWFQHDHPSCSGNTGWQCMNNASPETLYPRPDRTYEYHEDTPYGIWCEVLLP